MDDGLLTGFLAGQADNGNCNNGGGFGGWDNGSWIFAIILLALIFGNNGWGNGFGGGFGGGNGGGYVATAATQSDIQRGFDTQSIIGKLDGISNGLCDGFYAMNTSMLQGFNGVDNAVCNLGYQTAQLANGLNTTMLQGFNSSNVVAMQNQNATMSALQDCCCQTQRLIERGFCDTNYALATNTTSIIQNAHNDTDRVLAKLDAMEMSRKDETIAALREKLSQANFAASQSAQNAFFQANQDAQTAEILRRTGHDCPSAAYIVQPPTPVSFPTNCCGTFNGWGNNYGGGCNSGCSGCGC